MKTCVIESPYAGNVTENLEYLEKCILWCAVNGYAPYASHKMMTTALNDTIPTERALGIECGLAFRKIVNIRIFFIDLGWSKGMLAAKEVYDNESLIYIEEKIL